MTTPAIAVCGTCGAPPAVQWRRRPTDDELAALISAEQQRRDQASTPADTAGPTAGQPLLTAANTTIAVFACPDHAIHVDHAARIHSADCPAPHPEHLPACGCEPEPHPKPEELGGPKVLLPTGWTVPAAS